MRCCPTRTSAASTTSSAPSTRPRSRPGRRAGRAAPRSRASSFAVSEGSRTWETSSAICSGGVVADGVRRRRRSRRVAEVDFADAVRGTAVVVPVRREVECRSVGAGAWPTTGAAVAATAPASWSPPSGCGSACPRVSATATGCGRPPGRDKSGEVSVVVRVRPHAYFERQGDDIHSVVPVTFTEAYLGAEIEIGTVHGPVRAKIPAGNPVGPALPAAWQGRAERPDGGARVTTSTRCR